MTDDTSSSTWAAGMALYEARLAEARAALNQLLRGDPPTIPAPRADPDPERLTSARRVALKKSQ